MPKTLDIALHKARVYYKHGQLQQENQNQNRENSRNFFDNRKPGTNPRPYRKKNNSFPANKNFNKTGMNRYVPSLNGNKQVASGANATPLAIKCWKCNGPHYA